MSARFAAYGGWILSYESLPLAMAAGQHGAADRRPAGGVGPALVSHRVAYCCPAKILCAAEFQ